MGAGARQFGFMLKGLKALEPHFKKLQIAFHLVRGNPADTIPKLVKDTKAGLLVVDQSPVRIARKWREEVCNLTVHWRASACQDAWISRKGKAGFLLWIA